LDLSTDISHHTDGIHTLFSLCSGEVFLVFIHIPTTIMRYSDVLSCCHTPCFYFFQFYYFLYQHFNYKYTHLSIYTYCVYFILILAFMT
jgi:hypothetical protein